MGRLAGFRPPQFSEEDTWLPVWLQQCNEEWLDAETMEEDYITFEKRVEEFRDFNSGDSLRDKGGCDIGQLFMSGTDSSPFSCAHSANDVEHFHLCLSSDSDSENAALSNDACETETNYPVVAQPIGTLEVQKDDNLSTYPDSGAVNCTLMEESERDDKKIELLKLNDNVHLSEPASDAVELCIAASEALVINELINSDSLVKSSSASAILEASLKLKQARLEVWESTFPDSFTMTSDTDNLSDLDDITMEIVYEDAGIHFSELPGNELSVSRVKDTLESEHNDEVEHKNTSTSDCENSGNYNFDNDVQLKKALAAVYSGGDPQEIVNCNPSCDVGTDAGHCNDFSMAVNFQANCLPSVAAEVRKNEANTLTPESNPHKSYVSSSPIMKENDNCKPNIVQQRFQSRWLGGWSSNNEVKCATKKCSIPKSFVAQTSFLSESAYTAPDVNSFVQNHDKQALVASQLSIRSENFSGANDVLLLSQDEGSSSPSLVDPLCSVVPSSIPENVCSLPNLNYGDPVVPITIESKKDNVLGTPYFYNMPAEEENIARQTADSDVSEDKVSRRSAALRDYSVSLPSHTMLSRKDSHQKCSFLMEVKAGADLQILNKENTAQSLSPVFSHRTESHFQDSIYCRQNFVEETQPESLVKHLPYDKLQSKLLQCENQSTQKQPTRKRVHFSERETDIPDNKKVPKLQTASKPCYSTRAAKRLTRPSAHLESRAQQMDRYLRVNLDKKKKRLIFQHMEFLLTGFSQQKEKEIDGLIRKYGGIVLSQIPSANAEGKRSSRSKSRALPVVLCLKKIQSFKFLYGCAVNAYVLKVNWLIDSIAAGFVVQPNRYMILPMNISRNDQVYTAVKYNTHSLVFNNLGVMLHGKTKYFTNITTILKHGGGQIFKTLQGLIQTLETGRISMAVLVAEEETCASRHLRQCAMDQNIHVTSVYWIIKCLFAGQLIPLEEKGNSRHSPSIQLQRHLEPMELSQEI
ncbi:uncharacterized protein LOC121807812 isoform X1 [Salvia splendens]|uniref:uncharacterized protein LOC121807812 isoform X1 n=2 Tax=Salvia splendens TaxID=180675 RepID=UPI001C265F37|nr:uncharacterized protein LOC121807812 isoform X1 [Salvia splendens]XP_042064081.1 uncharacterized protein LOC121807812 isoform X1 [Salvia splendens]